MQNGFFLITGTSQGIGEALALKLLEDGHTVLGISRTRSGKLTSAAYTHCSVDLSDPSSSAQIMDSVDALTAHHRFDVVCLVNNACATDPIGPVETCPPAEIDRHVRIGLIAPMILTSLFIRKFASHTMRKKLAFISSGAAFTPLRDESIYCGGKAGLHMFARCVGLEQQEQDGGFEVISIGPGMVDTAMQEAVRSKSPDEFALAGFFQQAFEDGKLQAPAAVAEKIVTILASTVEQGQYVSVADV